MLYNSTFVFNQRILSHIPSTMEASKVKEYLIDKTQWKVLSTMVNPKFGWNLAYVTKALKKEVYGDSMIIHVIDFSCLQPNWVE